MYLMVVVVIVVALSSVLLYRILGMRIWLWFSWNDFCVDFGIQSRLVRMKFASA